ncbi:MAG: carbon starvation protein A [Pirellulales bacterium]|nr:carbon starvation protein A [Pirellulales bacterium]
MYLLLIFFASAVVLLAAYRVYGPLLGRLLQLDSERPTPAVALRDDVDFEPIAPQFLLGQHFSAIAAAGPIVGPILAGVAFGWLPALLWILFGSIFIGGVHDMLALVASIRHQARSIAEVVRDHMSVRSYLLFLSFVWLALVYIIVAFTDITAAAFVGQQTLESGQVVSGGGIASSSLMYLMLPIVMALLMRYTGLSLGKATAIFVPLIGVAIWLGQKVPVDLDRWLELTPQQTHKLWDVLLLGYCLVASVTPLWLLLQPRGHLGGYFLYIALIGGGVGLLFGPQPIEYPAFTGWTSAKGETLFPMLFITIACGACSGFHSLIASGTTSKQLRRETDARPIGYGAMLLEALVAILSLSCVMILMPNSDPLRNGQPNYIYAHGIGTYMQSLGIPPALAISFALMAFTTFVYDTLDVCTRLGRYIIQELTGWRGTGGRWFGTALTACTPLFFVTQTVTDAAGKAQPAWKVYWSLFGASNQLLAALTLLGVTVWLWRTRRAWWVWLVTGVPTVLMYVMSSWALLSMVRAGYNAEGAWQPATAVPWVAIILVALAALMLLEAIWVILIRPFLGTPPKGQPATLPAG